MQIRSCRSVSSLLLAGLCVHLLSCDHTEPNVHVQEGPDPSVSPDSSPPPVVAPWPPDPSKIASKIERTVATDIARSTEFIYKGSNPIQVGMTAGVIERRRVAILRGKVRALNGNALVGVKVTILSHPEYGHTETRADGQFDIVVNGGGLVTIVYSKEGYISAQRQVQTPWRDYVTAPEVVMVAYDSNVTEVKLNTMTSIETARGTAVEDGNGKRQATLMVLPGTNAIMSTGTSSQSLSTLHIRATEYTIGKDGPKAMPATLPATSGYTYAVELSADEAEKAGASKVEFSQPMFFYLENFLKFPVGGLVPVGFYDREKGHWVSSKNGKIIKVLNITNGKANVDVDGDDKADEGEVLTKLGVSDEERQRLATLYQPGQSLWRVPITHFTPWDLNWPYGPPKDAEPPKLPNPGTTPDSVTQNQKPNATIYNLPDSPCPECENQVLSQSMGIPGTPFSLTYQSDRTPGRTKANSMTMQLSGPTLPPSLKRIDLELSVAGRNFTQTFETKPNQKYTFTWDGNDAYGRKVQGVQPVTGRVGYVYDAIYQTPVEFERSFGLASGVPITGDRTRTEVTLWQPITSHVGNLDLPEQAMNGWQLSEHHIYDPYRSMLYRGDGRRQGFFSSTINTIAGTGVSGFSGDGGPATKAQISPYHISSGFDGSVYVAGYERIRKIGPDGIITTIAGDGTTGFSGDGGPAIKAKFSHPTSTAIDSEGSVYVADYGNSRIRKIGIDGIITTIAGDGTTGFSGDGGPATKAKLTYPYSISIGSDGSVYVADITSRIRKIGIDGIITTIAGDGTPGFSGDGGPATKARFYEPQRLAFSPDGSLYVPDRYSCRIRKIGPDGIVTTIAGDGTPGFSGDGGPATKAKFGSLIYGCVVFLTVGLDGSVYVSDYGNSRIRKIGTDGIITTIAGDGTRSFSGDGGLATKAQFSFLGNLVLVPDNRLYVSDVWNYSIRAIRPVSFATGIRDTTTIPSDDGTELFVFDAEGRHLRTVNAVTRTVRFSFTYDSAGRLVKVVDAHGDATTIERDHAGKAIAIVGAYGQRTTLASNNKGWLTRIENTAGESVNLEHTETGLLTKMLDPQGHAYTFSYDAFGLLTQSKGPDGLSQTLTKTEDKFDASNVVAQSAGGRTSSFQVTMRKEGGWLHTITGAGGQKVTLEDRPDGSSTATYPNGIVSTATREPDPRFGMLAPLVGQSTVKTPSGLTLTQTMQRQVQLSDPKDPLSLTQQTDTVTINGRSWVSTYDHAKHTVTTRSPMGRERVRVLNDKDQPTSSRIAGLVESTFAYDRHGQLTSLREGTRNHGFAYDAQGYFVSSTDPLSHSMSISRDASGRPTQQTMPDGKSTLFQYDRNSNLLSLTPPDRTSHAFTYTDSNLVKRYSPPSLGSGLSSTEDYTYNADQQLTQISQPHGLSISVNYDSAGRPSQVSSTKGNLVYSYDATSGQLTKLTDPNSGVLTYSYDGSLVTSQSLRAAVSGKIGYTYNSNFELIAESINDGLATDFRYDNDGVLTGVGSINLARDAQNGRITGTTLGDVTDTLTWNNYNEMTGYEASYKATPQCSTQYTHDALGRITQKIETILGEKHTYVYSYDTAGRLIESRKDDATRVNYSYGANGSRSTYTSGASTINATYDTQDRLTQYGSKLYEYNTNGDLTKKTEGALITTYEYDGFNNLTKVSLPDTTKIDYVFDGAGNRIAKKVNGTLSQGFLYSSELNPVAEVDASSKVIRRFVYATRRHVPDAMIKDGITYRIVSDHLGSPRLVIDTSTGTVVQKLEYDDFGNILVDTNPGFQPFGFAGGLYDAHTKLTHFGAREYDAETGRWTQKDPIGFAGGDTNLYRYVENNPVSFIDPNGLAKICYRPLAGPPIVVSPEFLRDINRAVGHAQIWFNSGYNRGFGPKGRFTEPPDLLNKEYSCLSQDYDDDVLREAVNNLDPQKDGEYGVLSNNCQHWVHKVLAEYNSIMYLKTSKMIRKTIEEYSGSPFPKSPFM